jgi:hypothetical protein
MRSSDSDRSDILKEVKKESRKIRAYCPCGVDIERGGNKIEYCDVTTKRNITAIIIFIIIIIIIIKFSSIFYIFTCRSQQPGTN